jgi:hypothetical protein
MAARPGAIVELRYDWWSTEDPPKPGDYLQTRAGSAYEIREIKETRRTGRYRIRALKLNGSADIPEGADVAGLHWDSRARRRA